MLKNSGLEILTDFNLHHYNICSLLCLCDMTNPVRQPLAPKVPPHSLLSATNIRPPLMVPPWASNIHPTHGSVPGYIYRTQVMPAFHVIDGKLLQISQQPPMLFNYPPTLEYITPGNQPHVGGRNLKPFGEQLFQGSKPQEAAHLFLSAPHVTSTNHSTTSLASLNSNPYEQHLPLSSIQTLRMQPPPMIQPWNHGTQGHQIPFNTGNGVYIYNQPMVGQLVPTEKSTISQSSQVVPHPIDIRKNKGTQYTVPHIGMPLVLNGIQQIRSQQPTPLSMPYCPIASSSGDIKTDCQGTTGIPSLQNAGVVAQSQRPHLIEQNPEGRSVVSIHHTTYQDNRILLGPAPLDVQTAATHLSPYPPQAVINECGIKKNNASFLGQKQIGSVFTTTLKGKSLQHVSISDSPQDSLETPLLQIKIPDIQPILSYADPLHKVIPGGNLNKDLVTKGYSLNKSLKIMSQSSQNTSALIVSLPQSDMGRPTTRHTIANETVHTTVDRYKIVTEVTNSEIISSSLDSREEKTVLAQRGSTLTHPMQRAEKVGSPGKIREKHTHLSEVHETKTLDLNDTTKEKQGIRGMLMVNDTLYTSASEELQLKQSHDKDTMGKEVATFPLGKSMCTPKPVNKADTKNVSRTGALGSDSGADMSKATKRKKNDIKEQPTKRAKSQTVVLNKGKSLQKYKCVCPGSENKSTTVNPENKLKVNDKNKKTQSKRKEVCTETEKESFKRHRSRLSLQMLESIQVFHPLGKKGQSTGAARASGNPAAPLSTEGHPSSTGRLTAKVNEKPLVSALRNNKISENSKISTQTVLPVMRDILVDKHSIHLGSTDNTRTGVRMMPRKEMRKESENRVLTMNMTNSKCLGDKQILSEDRARSLAGNGEPCPKVGSKMGSDSSKAIQLPSEQLPSATLKVPIEPALNPPAARPAAPIDHAVAFCGKDQRPERLQLSHLSHLPCPTKELEESIPISEEQRPEREAMKRRAQLERENACLYTSLGKLQFFVQRRKDHQYAKDFGYPDILLKLSKSYLLPD